MVGFIVTKSKPAAGNAVNVYNGRVDMENRIKEGKNAVGGTKRATTDLPPTKPVCS